MQHEQSLHAWKTKLETETVQELKQKSRRLAEWEAKLNRKEEILKSSASELDRRQRDVQKRSEEYNAKADKFERASAGLQEKRQEIEHKWKSASRKEIELESKAQRLADLSEELDKKGAALERYQDEISESQREITRDQEEVSEAKIRLQKDQLEVGSLRERLVQRAQRAEEEMREAKQIKEEDGPHKNDPKNYNERQKIRYDVLKWSKAADCPTRAQLHPELNQWTPVTKDGGEQIKSCKVDPESKKRSKPAAGDKAADDVCDMIKLQKTIKGVGPKGSYSIIEQDGFIHFVQYKTDAEKTKEGEEEEP